MGGWVGGWVGRWVDSYLDYFEELEDLLSGQLLHGFLKVLELVAGKGLGGIEAVWGGWVGGWVVCTLLD